MFPTERAGVDRSAVTVEVVRVLNHPLAHPELSVAAERVADLAAPLAARADSDRQLDRTVVDALLDAGFARHFVPTRWGGREGSFAEITEALTVLAAGCASTAWCASIAATLGRMAAYLPAEGQSEVWARGPDAFICGALMPAGRAESVDGGYRVSGEWAYMSGVEFSDWALVCSTVAVGERPEVRFFLVPRSAYRITDTWFNLGMRGTGSNTLVLGETFVPGSRSFTRDELVEGRAADATAACHNVPLRAVNSLSFAAPALGAARGAARTWSALVAPKIRAFTGNNRISGGDRGTLEIAFARATGEMDAAQLLVDRAAGIADQGAVTVEHTLRNARDSAVAVDLLASAVNRLFRVVGTRGQSEGHPFQRFWRDVHTATGHTVLQVDPAASAYGNHVLLRET